MKKILCSIFILFILCVSSPIQSYADVIYTHTVVKEDTLSKLAEYYYDDCEKYTIIFDANRDIIKDPNKIYPGMRIMIPKVKLFKVAKFIIIA